MATSFPTGSLPNNLHAPPLIQEFANRDGDRSVFAITDIPSGSVILTERPIVAAQFLWNKAYRYTACSHCLRSLESPRDMAARLSGNQSLVLPYLETENASPDPIVVVCPGGCGSIYCSEECRLESLASYHKLLCPKFSDGSIEILCDMWKHIHYPPETCSIMLLARIMAMISQSSDKHDMLERFRAFCHVTSRADGNAVTGHKLLDERFTAQQGTLIELLKEVVYDELFADWFTLNGFRSLLAMVGTNGQGIGTSSLASYYSRCRNLEFPDNQQSKLSLDSFLDDLSDAIDKESGEFTDCEGSGLYPIQSGCNHSCCPKAEVRFSHSDFTLSLVALIDIRQGDEVTISYLCEGDRDRSRHSRQKILAENYMFVCECNKCLEQINEEDVTSEDDDSDDVSDV